MTEYKIVKGTLLYVEDVVIEKLNEGWQCQGGVSVLPPEEGCRYSIYCQAMVREQTGTVSAKIVNFPDKSKVEDVPDGYIPVHMRVK